MAPDPDLESVAAEREDLPNASDVYDLDESIAVTDLFDDAFVRERTEFDSFDGLVAASPSDADSAAEMETVPEGAWDEFVAETTVFDDERELVMAARDNWVAERLDLD